MSGETCPGGMSGSRGNALPMYLWMSVTKSKLGFGRMKFLPTVCITFVNFALRDSDL